VEISWLVKTCLVQFITAIECVIGIWVAGSNTGSWLTVLPTRFFFLFRKKKFHKYPVTSYLKLDNLLS
jgi:hypothetical protein